MTVSDYQLPIDIANRAMQHLGARRLASLTETTRQAAEFVACYDKLRQAELRRNLWKFAARRTLIRPIGTTTFFLVPPVWSSTHYYTKGSIVQDSAGNYWQTNLPFNLNKTPGTDTSWAPYFGPTTITEYDSTQTYYPGELVWVAGAVAGLTSIFVSLTDNAANAPDSVGAYAAGTTYAKGDIVSYSGSKYISMVDLNVANTPASAHGLWDIAHAYSTNDVVVWTDGRIYTAASGSTGSEPSVTSTKWTAAASPPYVQPWLIWTQGNSAIGWCYYGGGVTMEMISPNILYPVGTGPTTQTTTSNVYALPRGFMRLAPQMPKAGSTSFLGAPSGLPYNDWELDDQFLVTSDSDPIALRFIADITDVSKFDPLFCEGLAARVAFELCEIVTQSTDKQRMLTGLYTKAMSEARLIDAIESDATESPLDDYIVARI